ncbi:MAG: pilin [bacterium]|nr:pilin [bacterium]
MKKVLLAFFLVALFLTWSNASFAQCVPPNINFTDCFRQTVTQSGQGYVASNVVEILENIGGFLMVIAAVLAGIVIVLSGVLYMSAGSNPTRAGTAKTVLKNGVIGALIMFAAGVIVNTIALLALDPFGFFS